jgi:hypothetical protein
MPFYRHPDSIPAIYSCLIVTHPNSMQGECFQLGSSKHRRFSPLNPVAFYNNTLNTILLDSLHSHGLRLEGMPNFGVLS